MAAVEHVQLARSLPIRLQRFFAVNPPRLLTTTPTNDAVDPDDVVANGANDTDAKPNPFLPHKNPTTGRWHPPIYSLRRQAEIVKTAQAHGVEELLPYSPKLTRERQKQREECGSRIQGTGEGRSVKGHIWERTLKGRLEKRRQAMLEMPRMIQEWKQARSKMPVELMSFGC